MLRATNEIGTIIKFITSAEIVDTVQMLKEVSLEVIMKQCSITIQARAYAVEGS